MDPIDHLRNEIKSHFPESSELHLSGSFSKHRRYNFYFKITDNYPHLLYLNWDGEIRFTLKCLEFSDADLLQNLIEAYPIAGMKIFNIGQPKRTVSFIYRSKDELSFTDLKGPIDIHFDWNHTSCKKLMECVDPSQTPA